jgi:uncharacterized protein YndB with AHSA1/START domain
MSEPLRIEFEVVCAVDHAFATWTERIGTWWPADHTVSGSPAAVVVEGRIGGRIYERTAHGEEHDWGLVTDWRPPEHLSYRWHLGAGPEGATDVDINFIRVDVDRTRVEIEQSGWERLGSAGPDLRSRNQIGWDSLIPHLRAAIEKGA